MSTTPHSGSDQEIQRDMERAKDEAGHLASSAADSARRRGREALDDAKEQAADRAEEMASALESTAEELGSSDDPLAGYGRSMAEFMRRFAGGLREHEIEEFAGQLAGFARRNPASFFAGSVALGFGVSRFLKSTSVRSIEAYGYADDEDDDYWFEREANEFDVESESDTSIGMGNSGTRDTSFGGDPAGSERWPEDIGRERPGSGSVADHWSPGAAPESPSPGSSGYASPAVPPDETQREGLHASGEEDRRNQP